MGYNKEERILSEEWAIHCVKMELAYYEGVLEIEKDSRRRSEIKKIQLSLKKVIVNIKDQCFQIREYDRMQTHEDDPKKIKERLDQAIDTINSIAIISMDIHKDPTKMRIHQKAWDFLHPEDEEE